LIKRFRGSFGSHAFEELTTSKQEKQTETETHPRDNHSRGQDQQPDSWQRVTRTPITALRPVIGQETWVADCTIEKFSKVE